MADPVSATLMVASAAGTWLQYEASSEQLAAQKSALEKEEEYLAQQRVYLNEARDEELDLFRRETKELLGLQTVGFAKTGVELSGSVIKVLNQTELDALEEEDRIIKEYDRARTLSQIESSNIRGQIRGIGNQQGLMPLMRGFGTIASGMTGYYTGRKLQ